MRLGGLALTLVAASALVAPAPAQATTQIPAQRTITLISGDRLLVSADGRAASRVPGSDRDGIALITERVGGRLRVVPADAVPLLAADRLDPRLFDVTGLLAAGYDDSRADLPLIVTFDGRPSVGALVPGAAAGELAAVNGSGVRVTRAQAAALWSKLTAGTGTYRKIWLDGVARPASDVSVPLVGGPAAWAAGLTGGGVAVGVLDTGLDADHPDLAGAIAETADFTGGGDGGVDRAGHGTAVASVLAGSGAASGGRYRGMAPDVRLYGAKVCASPTACQESAILEGMRWAVQDKGVKVVNLSAGEPDTPGTDLLEEAVDRLTAEFGALFVVAAGNGGEVRSPASAPAALAVGATTEDDAVARFSPAEHGGKPDLLAPGVDITGARSGDSELPGKAYTTLSGTSLSAPHAAGAAALLAQQHPEWTPAQIKATLVNAATPLAGVRAGRLDVAMAVDAPLPVTGRPDPAPETFRLTATAIDRSGLPTGDVYARAYSDEGAYDLNAPLPAGTYTLDAKVVEPDGSVTLLTRPAVRVDRDLDLTVDARLGKPITVTSPGPGQVYAYAGFTRGPTTAGVMDDSFAGMTAAQLGPAPAVPGFQGELGASWASGPDFWSAAWTVPGRWITGFARTPRDFVSRTAVYDGAGDAVMVRHPAGAWGYASRLRLPVTRTEHLLGGTSWGGEFTGVGGTLTAAPTTATATDADAEEWNRAVRGPAFAPGHEISETHGVLVVDPAWRSDSSGHGAPPTGTTTVTRGARTTVTHVDGRDRTEWVFPATRSATRTLIPLPVVRFTPGAEHTLSFAVQHQAGGGVTAFGLDVSYDGGHSWQRPFFTRIGDRGLAVLRPPVGASVSLRATATNGSGATVRQTLIDAYPI